MSNGATLKIQPNFPESSHDADTPTPKLKIFTERQLDRIPHLRRLSDAQRFEMRVVAQVLPFRVNDYVLDELIDWERVPNDAIFQLTFPQRDMLEPEHYDRIAALLAADADASDLRQAVAEIRAELNPHPAGQMAMNVPELDGEALPGMQHKYRETVLFFPTQGQTCHSYCSFCFRWPQFVGDKELRFASNEADTLHRYLRRHREVTDLLVTGGDPMVMKTHHLASYLRPLTHPDLDHVQDIRIGTKSLTFWPHRYVTDPDADALLELLAELVAAGKHVALMAHYNHPQELRTEIARTAIRRLREAGVTIRSQGPLLRHINDDAHAWARLWKGQVKLGVVPYYMFIERDTGAKRHFELPLAQAYEIYRDAVRMVSGLARTVRGPSMSAGPGKVEILGIEEIAGEKVFVLRFLQARNPEWSHRPFFARFDPEATWLDHLKPAFGEKAFFWEAEYRRLSDTA